MTCGTRMKCWIKERLRRIGWYLVDYPPVCSYNRSPDELGRVMGPKTVGGWMDLTIQPECGRLWLRDQGDSWCLPLSEPRIIRQQTPYGLVTVTIEGFITKP